MVEDGEGSFKILDPNTILSMHAIKVRKIRVTDVAFPSNFTSNNRLLGVKYLITLQTLPNGCKL